MLGWEFPPFFAGGLGVVCSELAHALVRVGVDVTFVMPSGPDEIYDEVNHVSNGFPGLHVVITNNRYKGANIRVKKVKSLLAPYIGSNDYDNIHSNFMKTKIGKSYNGPVYGKNLREEVQRFAQQAMMLADEEDFDVIHAHDWVTFPAAIALKAKTGKPMVIHVHITEFDKTGGNSADPYIYGIEKLGMETADRVIAISQRIKERCINQYGINPNKISIVHNAATSMDEAAYYDGTHIKGNDKIVLFAGRVTLQKGPDYFVEAAKKVLEHAPNTKFVVAGTGDMLPQIINKVAYMGLASKFIFTGFYTREDAEKLFSMADVFVMPSVSEPFGVVPYEAQLKGTPTIISKQSGISEVLYHTLKVDFWDINQLANKILALLNYGSLHGEMKERGYHEAKASTWDIPAAKCLNIYNELVSGRRV